MKAKKLYYLPILLATAVFMGCEDHGTHQPPYEGPPKENIISLEQAKEMYAAYSQRRVPIIQKYEDGISTDSSKFTPTRYAEFDINTVKQYIAYIEHEAKEANVEISTLRFYLSNYPNSEEFSNGATVKYPRRNSFFVVPTMENLGVNVGFLIENIEGKQTAIPIGERIRTQGRNEGMQNDSTGTLNQAGFFTAAANNGQESKSLILNDGNLSPPPGQDDFGNAN